MGKNILNIPLQEHQQITGRNKLKKTRKSDNATVHRRKGRPNLLDDEFLVKVKDVVDRVRMTGGIIFIEMVITIGTGVIKGNCPSKLKDFGGYIH